ncbi:MAG: hypothetical protein ACI9SP_003725 [Arenicella sp.]|jgi:hypothetical protein
MNIITTYKRPLVAGGVLLAIATVSFIFIFDTQTSPQITQSTQAGASAVDAALISNDTVIADQTASSSENLKSETPSSLAEFKEIDPNALNFGVEALPEQEVVQHFDQFYSALFESGDPMTEEQIGEFFNSLNKTLHNSPIARELVQTRLHESLVGHDPQRLILQEALYGSNVGMQILKDEAVNLLAQGYETVNVESFQILENVQHLMGEADVHSSIEQAVIHLSNYSDDLNALPASSFLSTMMSRRDDVSDLHRDMAVRGITKAAENSASDEGDFFHTQALYFMTDKQKSSEIAAHFLTSKPSSGTVLSVLEGIQTNYIELTQEVRSSLSIALNRADVTERELALAQGVMSTSGS